MLRFLKHALILLVLMWGAIVLGGGDKFDDACIVGRISSEQAVMITASTWGYCPNDSCEAAEGDRVFAGECSNLLKFTWKPEKWMEAFRTGKLP